MKFSNELKIKGNVKILTRSALTGKILSMDEGENLVLNSGLESLCRLIAGESVLPAGSAPGRLLATLEPLPNFPFYMQFGTNSTPPEPADKSPLENGTLDINVISPTNASPIIHVVPSYPTLNSVMLQGVLLPNQGNSFAFGGEVNYTEVVLMSKYQEAPPKFKWFSRRVFSSQVKTSQTMLECEYTLTFTTKEGIV